MGSIVVVSPHPDDLEIGVGGTVARARAEGRRVVSVVVTDGRRSPRSFECRDDEMAAIRRTEAVAAAKALDLDVPPQLLGLPDVKSEATRRDAREALEARFRGELADHGLAEVFVTHPELDRHATHRTVAEVTLQALVAAIAATGAAAPDVWFYEIWSPFPKVDRLVDIGPFVDVKDRAIAAHASQCRDKDYADGARGLSRYRAVFAESHEVTTGSTHAEGFVRGAL